MESNTATSESAANERKAVVFDVGSLWAELATLADSRHKRGVRYPLVVILLLIVLAKLSGEDRAFGIADWAKNRTHELVEALHLSYPRMPHHNTYRRIIEDVVDPEELDAVASRFLMSLPGSGDSVLVAIDGKTVRGTIRADNGHREHLLAAYLPEEGIVLMQVAAGDKENEITVAPKLLKCLDLRGKIVAGDAMHTQRELSVQILDAGGDYLWLAKDNQPTLRADIEEVFTADDSTVIGGKVETDFETYRTVDKGHGRLERRQITTSSSLKDYSDWPGLEQVFKLERQRVENKTCKEENEVVYGLTSLTRAVASPQRLLDLNRKYWGIENGLHNCRDTTFQEDRCRLTRGHAGRVMATINSLVIGLLRRIGHTNLARARRLYDARFHPALRLLIASPLRL